MTTSLSTNYTATATTVITRALRVCNAVAQGETPTTTQITEATQALNDIVKKMQGSGMQLWKRTNSSFTPVASTKSYVIGVGFTLSQLPPLKLLQAWYRNTTTTNDTPINLITRSDYEMLGNKSSTGTPNQIYYDPPGSISTGAEKFGTFYVYPAPDATFAAGNTIYFTGVFELYEFDSATDNVDFPSFYFNALVWNLAKELAYEYGVPLAERAMIAKTAKEEMDIALGFDQEEGSTFFQPSWYR